LLVGHFIRKHSGGRKVSVTPDALAYWCAQPWRGNVRELENAVRRSLVMGGDTIDREHVGEAEGKASPGPLDLRAKVDALQTRLIRDALRREGGNQTRASEALGVSRFGLQKMLKRLKIDPP
jgi:DNA-binding NtrC family response regulator